MPETQNNAFTVLTVADLHQSIALYADLVRAVEKHRPDIVAVVGDCLHAGEDMDGRLATADCAGVLFSLPCREIVFSRGNHEDENWLEFVETWKKGKRTLNALYGEVFQFGPLSITGYPCYMGDETHYRGDRKELLGASKWVRALLREHGPAAGTLWLMHETPLGTPLSDLNSIVAGNHFWNDAIKIGKPLLTVHGHDHVSPIRRKIWHSKLGETMCVNVGQYNHGPLRYTLVNAEFDSVEPSLPVKITVTAYPMGETISVK